MQRHLIVTRDGSPSISVPRLHVAYHSIHGAIAESQHVFIDAGWKHIVKKFWEKEVELTDYFRLTKRECSLLDYTASKKFHLIFFHAFAPAAQPELWTTEVFQQLFSMMVQGGALVTYCAKGDVRRAMKQAGFEVERLKGPPGKREMLRATCS